MNYAPAYLLWDRAGEIARRLSKLWPDWKLEQAQPGVITARAGSARLNTALDASFVNIQSPKAFSSFSEQIANSFQIWTELLEIRSITKIGGRAIYIKDLKTREEANSEYQELGLANWPTRDVFNIRMDSSLNSGSIHYQIEDDASSVAVRIAPTFNVIEIDNSEFPELSGKKEIHRLIVDVDRQTKKTTEADRFSPNDWLKGYHHLLNRDLSAILNKKKRNSDDD